MTVLDSRKWVGLFMRTLWIGAIACLLTSFVVKYDSYVEVFQPFQLFELFGLLLFFGTLGLIFSVISQTGFFAYLFLNRFCHGLFRSYWPVIQVLLIAFVLFDLIYFPYQATKGVVEPYWYILMTLALLGYGWIVAKIKAKQTKTEAFVPALFVMIVITTIEWVPGLQVQGVEYAWLMIFPLLLCNTYQLLSLHKLIGEEDESGNGQDGTKGKLVKA